MNGEGTSSVIAHAYIISTVEVASSLASENYSLTRDSEDVCVAVERAVLAPNAVAVPFQRIGRSHADIAGTNNLVYGSCRSGFQRD